MANSDNVLRCGLTPKHVDVPSCSRSPTSPRCPSPLFDGHADEFGAMFAVPVPDFKLLMVDLDAYKGSCAIGLHGPFVVLCASGSRAGRVARARRRPDPGPGGVRRRPRRRIHGLRYRDGVRGDRRRVRPRRPGPERGARPALPDPRARALSTVWPRWRLLPPGARSVDLRSRAARGSRSSLWTTRSTLTPTRASCGACADRPRSRSQQFGTFTTAQAARSGLDLPCTAARGGGGNAGASCEPGSTPPPLDVHRAALTQTMRRVLVQHAAAASIANRRVPVSHHSRGGAARTAARGGPADALHDGSAAMAH